MGHAYALCRHRSWWLIRFISEMKKAGRKAGLFLGLGTAVLLTLAHMRLCAVPPSISVM
jgi:hypothetical protein